ncbi:MAG TPA: response regulator transcription factor [Elusimicrobiales bacterium]|nr:response regulator transcription factor [Elusimicrobiales bacterium]
MASKTILAVDDDEEVRRFYGRMFSGAAAMNVALASSGAEALEFVSSAPCDCVILDLAMPGMSGFEVLEKIRSRPELGALPVVVVTASREDRDGVRALSMGADDYINKPFSAAVFEAKMLRLLERRADPAPARDAGRGAGILEAGPVRMDLRDRRAWVSGAEVSLTDKEFDLLCCVFRRAPGLVRWDVIHREVWSCCRPGEIQAKQSDALQVTLSRLKRKLGPDVSAMLMVQKGLGLRFELRSLLP